SLVAKEVARRTGRVFFDTDEEIVKLAGKSVAEIFTQDGESDFRRRERQVVEEACQQHGLIIALGGGAIMDHHDYELLAESGYIICLEARPQTIYRRLFQQDSGGSGDEIRPLIAGAHPLEQIRQLKDSRQPFYAGADWTIHTDVLTVSQVAVEVLRAVKILGSAHRDTGSNIACMVITPTQSYPVFVGDGLLGTLGEKLRQEGLSGHAVIISDENVFSLYGYKVKQVLGDSEFDVLSFVISPGEKSKGIGTATRIYDFLVEQRVERDDVIVALGGGVVGDLAGFVAATFLRGLSWVQVPTSLMAMVDASIGGKVAIDHSRGKNLIGAFYQPRFVLADIRVLTSLPQREFTSGWAEVIKHGLIIDRDFATFLDQASGELLKLEPGLLTQAVARSAAIKAEVVTEDEKEAGKRTILNYGHTIAHGLETATGYSRFLHGEAVSVGMVGAANLSQRLGLLSPEDVLYQQTLLQKFCLPVNFSGVDLARVMRAMELDKKVKRESIRWVLLDRIGHAVVRTGIAQEDVMSVLEELSQPWVSLP
ncbi:MAG: 3-dehydroquinate synthase, partial [Chloroflexota bacterium]|nr:3-dehydroquinate synthase [Chloroflexota bacterium]